MGALSFEILGPLRVVRDGLPLDLGPPRQRATLAVLLLRAGQVVTADVLTDALWPDGPPATARNIVHTYVSKLRHVLEPDREPRAPGGVLRSESSGYLLDVPADHIDARRFEHLLSEARAGRDDASRPLEEALAMWRGRALAEICDEPLGRPEAERLEELRLAALEMHAEAELAHARHEPLVPRLRALVSEHPLRERLTGALMLALHRSGRHGEALLAYSSAAHALRSELGVDPGPELRSLHAAILTRDPALDAAVPRTNLPALGSSFVGRSRELAEARALLSGSRMLTFYGAGGCGKTRLAIRVSSDLVASYRDGVWWVDLAPLADASLVVASVGAALGVADAGGGEQLAHAVRSRELLLLLDNCEHVLHACGGVVAAVMRHAPGVHVLATSREPLHVDGEVTYEVLPMSVDESVRLFAERAHAVRPGFALDDENAETVQAICRELDGLPLAVELAAARTRLLSPAQIADGLTDRFRLLRTRTRTALPRHRTLQACVDWSYQLLTADERNLLSNLSVFAGSFDLAGAGAVAGRSGIIDDLTALVEKSLVRAEVATAGGRYRLLETIRQYALVKVEEAGDAASARSRHLEHYLALLGRTTAQDRRAWLEVLAPDLDNIRAAMDYAVAQDEPDKALRMAGRVWPLWYERGLWNEMRRRVVAALGPSSSDTGARVRALVGVAALAFNAGDMRAAHGFWKEAADLALEGSDARTAGRALAWLALVSTFLEPGRAEETAVRAGHLAESSGDAIAESQALTVRALYRLPLAESYPMYAESAARSRRAGDPLGQGFALHQHAAAAVQAGDFQLARQILDEHLALARRVGNVFFEALAVSERGNLANLEGDDAAAALLADGLSLHESTGALQGEAIALRHLAWFLYARAELQAAAVHVDRAMTIWRRIENAPHVAWGCWTMGEIAAAQGDHAAARERFDEALRLAESGALIGGELARARALVGLARLGVRDARDLGEALHRLEAAGYRVDLVDALETAAHVALREGRTADVATLLARAGSLRKTIGYVRFPVHRDSYEQCAAAVGRGG